MPQQGSQIGVTGLNNATDQTKVFDGKFDSNIQPKTVNLTLSTYEDPLYGQTTRLKVDNDVKPGKFTMIKSITDDTLGPKIHAANLPAVSNDIKTKLSTIAPILIDGFNNPSHANKCVKATGYGQSSDIENIICQLRQQYDAAADNIKKEELFNFIKYLNTQKTANNTNWRFETYTDSYNALHKVEEYYKQLLGTFVPTVSTEEQKEEINKLLDQIKQPLNKPNDAWTNEQLSGIDLAAKEITLDTNIRSSYAAYIYNLNQLKSLFKNDLYYNYTVVSKSKPMSKDDMYKFIVNTKNVASRNASAAVSATGTAFSNFGTGLSTMGKSALDMAKSATATQAPAPQQPAPQQSNATAPAKSSWWPFGKGGKSKKNKKSNSKKQKKSSRKQQKRRKSSKK
jgi:hypothetical protein